MSMLAFIKLVHCFCIERTMKVNEVVGLSAILFIYWKVQNKKILKLGKMLIIISTSVWKSES